MSNIRISAISFKSAVIKSFDDFADHASRLVDRASDTNPDFIVFPELFVNELMTFFDEEELISKFQRVVDYSKDYTELFKKLAQNKSVYIIGGSHVKKIENKLYNVSQLFSPDGAVFEQKKLHMVPAEVSVNILPGDKIATFQTDKAKISILTCYDLEFPETVRLATLQGAEILFSPSATMDVQGYWRVRHCAQARCIENQVFTVHCSLLGNWGVPGLEFYGTSSILSPAEACFPEKGIVAEGVINQETIVSAEIDTEKLVEVRKNGSAPTLKDKRLDMLEALYRVEKNKEKAQ